MSDFASSVKASEIAKEVAKIAYDAVEESNRSAWAKDYKIGISDIGGCAEYLRRFLLQEEFSDPGNNYAWAAFVGTALGDKLEAEYKEIGGATQADVSVRYQVGDFEITLPGHPDLVIGNEVRDFKSKDGLDVIRKAGPDRNHIWQVTGYANGLIDAGILDPDAGTIWLSLVYLDRSGKELEPHVVSWEYNPQDFVDAQDWLRDVLYAINAGETAARERPYQWCQSTCAYFSVCRGAEGADGLLEDAEQVAAAQLYVEAQAEIRAAEKKKDTAKKTLEGVSGRTEDGVTVRWTHVGPTEVAYTRGGYDKIDVRAPRKKG